MNKLKLIWCLCITFVLCNGENPWKWKNRVTRADKHHGGNLWHSYRFGTGASREDLNITNVRRMNFNFGSKVTKWKTLNLHNESILIGHDNNSLTILRASLSESNDFQVAEKRTEFPDKITAFTFISIWNRTEKNMDNIIVVAKSGEDPSIYFYRIRKNNELEYVFHWSLYSEITHLKVFKSSKMLKLLIVHRKVTNVSHATADIYNFVINDHVIDIWLHQTILLNHSANSSAINQFRSDFYLAIPQKDLNLVKIFKLVSDKFVPDEDIISKDVDFVCEFKVGFKSYLAVGGGDFAIYSFTKTGLQKEQMDKDLPMVEYLQPVYIKTYRDELILLIQFNSGNATEVLPVTYSKEKFSTYNEVPCTVFERSDQVKCSIKEEWKNGITGSGVISLGDKVGLVVPKNNANSDLFLIETSLLPLKNPTMDKINRINGFKTEVQVKLTKQQMMMSEIEMRLANRTQVSGRAKRDSQDTHKIINDLKLKLAALSDDFRLLENNLNSPRQNNLIDVDTLTVLNNIEVKGNVYFRDMKIQSINDIGFNDLISNCARRNRKNDIAGRKTFRNANVQKITSPFINNLDANKFRSNAPVIINGNLTISDSLEILQNVTLRGKINNFDPHKDFVTKNSNNQDAQTVHFQNLTVDSLRNVKFINDEPIRLINQNSTMDFESLHVPNISLIVDTINSKGFSSVLDDACSRDTGYSIPTVTTVLGNMVVTGGTTISSLNGLDFPGNYLVRGQSSFAQITGKKTFKGKLTASEVVVNDLVSGKNPNELITLSTNQTVPGNFTFTNLEITESLNVTVITPNGRNALLNPTLEEHNIIASTLNFKSLEIIGSVTAVDFEGPFFKKSLDDVVYKDDTNAVINSTKTMTSSVQVNNLNIKSQKINDININSMLTRDTEQFLKNVSVKQNAIIDKINVEQYYDGISISHLFQDVIQTTDNISIASKINFENIRAPEIHISRLNNYIYKNTLVSVPKNGVFQTHVNLYKLKADTMIFEKDFNHEIHGFDIHLYEANRMKTEGFQNITGPVVVTDCYIDHVNVKSINNISLDQSGEFNDNLKKAHKNMLEGERKIIELIISGNLIVNKINGIRMDELFDDVFWVDRDQNFTGKLIFQNDVQFSQLNTKSLNNGNLDYFISDIVMKHESSFLLRGHKTFKYGFKVYQNLDAKTINNIDINNILRKSSEPNIAGNVIVHGNVTVQNLNVSDTLNEISLEELRKKLQIEDDRYLLNDSVVFDRGTKINNLKINGLINSRNWFEYYRNIVHKGDDYKLLGDTIFQNKVHVKGNLAVGTTVNDINLHSFAKNVAIISKDVYIHGEVTFKQDVSTIQITVDDNLNAATLSGYNINEIKEKSVSFEKINGPLKLENVTVHAGCTIQKLNGVPMSDLIVLNSDEIIDGDMNFKFISVDNDLDVGGLVNGVNLEEVYSNTLLMTGAQVVRSKVIFRGPVTISKYLKTTAPVNSKNLQRIVSLNHKQYLNATYVFTNKVTLESDLSYSGYMNGINLTTWKEKLVTNSGSSVQNISHAWNVENVTFKANAFGGPVSNLLIDNVYTQLQYKLNVKAQIEKKWKDDYTSNCTNVFNLVTGSNLPKYLYKYLEVHQHIEFQNDINSVHHFKSEKGHYMIVNIKNYCSSALYQWLDNMWIKIFTAETGEVQQYISVPDSDKLYLVLLNKPSNYCSSNHLNIWVFQNQEISKFLTLNETNLIQQSKIEGTFYSLDKKYVMEYKIYRNEDESNVLPFRKWLLPQGDFKFNPHGMRLGLSVRNKDTILKLARSEPKFSVSDGELLSGRVTEIVNPNLPTMDGEDVFVLGVTVGKIRRKFVAVTVHEDTSVKGRSDFIKIYEDIFEGVLFQKLRTYKPCCLKIVSLDNDETLLVLLEDHKVLQIYKYKGIEGFKHHSTAKIEGTDLQTMALPLKPYEKERHFISVVNKNVLTYLHAVMIGDRLKGEFNCDI